MTSIRQYNNRVDVRGHKYVFGPTQNHFSPSVARVKMSSEKGQKHIYAQERQLYYYYNNFKGILTFNFDIWYKGAVSWKILCLFLISVKHRIIIRRTKCF